jgi:hypothetical protein
MSYEFEEIVAVISMDRFSSLFVGETKKCWFSINFLSTLLLASDDFNLSVPIALILATF